MAVWEARAHTILDGREKKWNLEQSTKPEELKFKVRNMVDMPRSEYLSIMQWNFTSLTRYIPSVPIVVQSVDAMCYNNNSQPNNNSTFQSHRVKSKIVQL